jgi:hypothetical protein
MISNLKGGFFFFFAACLIIMGVLVFFLVPETKGRTLERMDEIFGTAYGDLHELELSAYRRDLEFGPGKPKKTTNVGCVVSDQVDGYVEGHAEDEIRSVRREVREAPGNDE